MCAPASRGIEMGSTQHRSASLHLATIVTTGVAIAFSTALIFTTGDLLTLWPLYVLPIVVAALAYHVAGAIVVSAISAALLSLMLYSIEADLAALPELVVGMTAFTVSGLVIGWQAQRSLRHSRSLEEASILDQLTGRLKREHLEYRLAEEVRRAERYTLTTSFAIVRVDCFEEFKDQFGRYKAEIMLEHLGEVIDVNVRDTDIVGRYDATSFGLILPYTDREGAMTAARHVSEKVRETEFEGDALEPTAHCTVSIGVATFPDDGASKAALMLAAEEGLTQEEGNA